MTTVLAPSEALAATYSCSAGRQSPTCVGTAFRTPDKRSNEHWQLVSCSADTRMIGAFRAYRFQEAGDKRKHFRYVSPVHFRGSVGMEVYG